MKTLLITTLSLFFAINVFSQNGYSWENFLEHLGQSENIDDGSLEQLYDELSELSETKLDINTCSREQLESLPFLSFQQVMDIMEYRDKVRRIESPMELFLVESLDRQAITLLKQFITIGPAQRSDTIPDINKVLKYGKNTLIADLNIPFYTRKGYENKYLGYKYKHWLRYTFNYGQRVKFGITASQDAGEPFFAGKNKWGYDYYSFYLLLNDIKCLKTLALGRYRLRFGMGLILNNGFGFGKLATMSTLLSSPSHVFAHASRSDYNYLQGAAATFKLAKGLDLTAFASYRKIDATLNNDSTSVATIVKTGYHRTLNEMNRKGNTAVTLFGGNVNWLRNGFHVGATGYYTSFNRKLNMYKGQKYRRWNPYGYDFFNASIDYGYLSRRLNISGETAIDKNAQIATINTISYELSSRLTLMALQRYYPYKYQALYANTIAEGGSVNDESGFLIGGKINPWNNATLTLYTDISYFAWPKYNTPESTYRWDNFIQFDTSKDKWAFLLRYRMKMKELNGQEEGSLLRKFDSRARASLSYSNNGLTLSTQSDFTASHGNNTSYGYMISESVRWQQKWLKLLGLIGFFHTADYDSRVYIYDPGLLYTFSFASFYGKGLRFVLNCKVSASEKLTFVLKGGCTHYFDRDAISSGPQQIDSSTISELEMQMQWKF